MIQHQNTCYTTTIEEWSATIAVVCCWRCEYRARRMGRVTPHKRASGLATSFRGALSLTGKRCPSTMINNQTIKTSLASADRNTISDVSAPAFTMLTLLLLYTFRQTISSISGISSHYVRHRLHRAIVVSRTERIPPFVPNSRLSLKLKRSHTYSTNICDSTMFKV